MRIKVKVFPGVGLCCQTQELEIPLGQGSLKEIIAFLEEQPDIGHLKSEKLLLLHNGSALDVQKDTAFLDGDTLWLTPRISGG